MARHIRFFSSMFLVCTLLSSGLSFAQVVHEIDKSLSTSKMKSRARNAEEIGDVYTALFYNEAILARDTSNIDARYQVAESYKATRNYKKAVEAYSIVVDKNVTKYPKALFEKGVMLKMCGEYDRAKEVLLNMQKSHSHYGDKEFHAVLHREISGCDSAIIFKEFHKHARVKNIGPGVNQPHREFSPFLTDSTHLEFAALRMDKIAYYSHTGGDADEAPVSQLYTAEKVDGEWKETGKMDFLNNPKKDMGHFAYSVHSKRYYFTECENRLGKKLCKIFFIEKTDQGWSKAKALPEHINLDNYTATHPAVGLDSASNIEYLYFVSDRPLGKGGLDIWFTHYNKHSDTWAHPVNYHQANTPETEFTPYYHEPTHTLYFSSDGHVSVGGLDIYKVKKAGKKVTTTQDLAFPINSPQDDYDFMLDEHGKVGFFVSNRPGGTPFLHETCCVDIYSFELIPDSSYDVLLELDVVLPDSSYCPGIKIYVRDYNHQNGKIEKTVLSPGNCHLRVLLNKNHYYTYKLNSSGHDSVNVSTEYVKSPAVIHKKLILKKEVIVKKEVVYLLLKDKPKPNEFFILKDIQYPENESELNQEAITMLDSTLIPFLHLHPEDTLLIHSFTDEVGSANYNVYLSGVRADKVVKYLAEHGINPGTLKAKGFGKEQPLAPNENPDGSDNPEGRQLNRRTEFILLKPQKLSK